MLFLAFTPFLSLADLSARVNSLWGHSPPKSGHQCPKLLKGGYLLAVSLQSLTCQFLDIKKPRLGRGLIMVRVIVFVISISLAIQLMQWLLLLLAIAIVLQCFADKISVYINLPLVYIYFYCLHQCQKLAAVQRTHYCF